MIGQPFFRASRDAFYVNITPPGKKRTVRKLGKTKEEADERLEKLKFEFGVGAMPVSHAIDLYLAYVKATKAVGTYDRRKRPLTLLSESFPTMAAADLMPHHVSEWVDTHFAHNGNTTKSDLLGMVSTAWTWLVRNHRIKSQISKLDRPPEDQREFYLQRHEWQAVLDVAGKHIRPLYAFMFATGARPQEARILTASMWGEDRFTIPRTLAKGRRRPRVIYVPYGDLDLMRLGVGDQPVFTNSRSNPWTKSAINSASRRIKDKLNMPEFVAYTCRHSFCAAKVSNGVDIAVVAQLMGHSDTSMVMKRYGHLAKQHDLLQSAVNRS